MALAYGGVTGAGNSSQFTAVGDTPNWRCVDEIQGAYPNTFTGSADSDTTYVGCTTATTVIDLYTIDISQVPSNAKIVSFRVLGRAKKVSGTGTHTLCIRVNGTNYFGTGQATSASYVSSSTTWSSNPNTSKAWTVEDLAALEIGTRYVCSVAGDFRFTSIYIEFTYRLVKQPIQSFGLLPVPLL